MTDTPAGWYPDPGPGAPTRLRYWDGGRWTEHTAPPPETTAPTPGPTTPDGQGPAGWWYRVAAYVIDGVILGVANGVATLPVQIDVQRDMQDVLDRFSRQIDQDPDATPDFGGFFHDYVDVFQAHWVGLVLPGVIITALYWAVFLRWKAATPGKLMLGLRVRLHDQPGRLPWASIVARIAVQAGIAWAAYGLAFASGSVAAFVLLGVVTIVMLLDPLWATWDERRQTLHDKAARTVVVRTKD